MEVIDFHGRRYYTQLTRVQLENLMDTEDRIFFPFSNRGIRTSQIVDYGPADTETVMIEWEISKLDPLQKRVFAASMKAYNIFWDN